MKRVLPPLLCMLLASRGRSEGDQLEASRDHAAQLMKEIKARKPVQG